MRKLILIITLFHYCQHALAQTSKADRLFDNWEYHRAAELYEKEAVKNPSVDVYYKLGECYMKMDQYSKALTWFDKVNEAGQYNKPVFYLHYGQLLKIHEEYDQAKNAFKKYSKLVPSDKKGRFYAESCDMAVEEKKSDLPIDVMSVSALNTPYAEICPTPYKDGIVFTSARNKGTHTKTDSWSGSYYLSLFFAKSGNVPLAFSEPVSMASGDVEQKYHDGPAVFSANGDTMYFTRAEKHLKGEKKKTLNVETIKIYTAVNVKGKWKHLKPFEFNNDTFSVACPALSHDGSKIYFVSDMPGGYGQTDIWYCKRRGDGWSKPINMGPKVNTFGREKYPYEDQQGNFFFSSDGYQAFGGLDICVAANKDGELQKAVPLKEPINSAADDYGIMCLDDRRGYITSSRKGGRGEADIYFFEIDPRHLVLTSGYIMGYSKPVKPILEKKTVSVPPTEPVVAPPAIPVAVKRSEPVPDATVPDAEEIVIHFDLNKSEIRPGDAAKLDKIAAWLTKNPNLRINVNGHTDSRASEQYNLELSRKRSQAAIDYLEAHGVAHRRMKAVEFGFTRLINFCGKGVNCTEAMHAQNRRVEFSLR